MGGCVGQRASVGVLENRKCLAPAGIWTLNRPARSPATVPTAQPRLNYDVSRRIIVILGLLVKWTVVMWSVMKWQKI